jgi:hypothetical protein
MAEAFEDFLLRLARLGDPSVLDKIDGYIDGYLAPRGEGARTECRRVTAAYEINAPNTELGRLIHEKLLKHSRKSRGTG